MKKLFFSIFLFLLSLAVNAQISRAQDFYGTTDLKTFREGRDKEFRDPKESPLREKDFATFKGLKYYSLDQTFRVAAEFKPTRGAKFFRMPTSSQQTQRFAKYGELKFKLNGQEITLNVYQAEAVLLDEKLKKYQDLLFVPFKDLTNGAKTYGGGRYLDVKIPPSNKVILDFNLAYNPSCAYGSDKFSCPIPPKENHLPIKIEAGEQSYLSDKENEHKK
ncbi:MAG: DUF1684 domain-containing protein [Pyrinomonadaceae bacterium]